MGECGKVLVIDFDKLSHRASAGSASKEENWKEKFLPQP